MNMLPVLSSHIVNKVTSRHGQIKVNRILYVLEVFTGLGLLDSPYRHGTYIKACLLIILSRSYNDFPTVRPTFTIKSAVGSSS